MHKKDWHWQRRELPKHLLREPLALTPLQLLTPVAKLLGKPHQPLATSRGKAFDPGARCAFGTGPRPPIPPPTHISPALLLTPACVVHVDVFAPSLEQIVDPWPRLGMCFLCVAAESLYLYGGVFSVGGVNIFYRFLWRSDLASCFENILLLSTRAWK